MIEKECISLYLGAVRYRSEKFLKRLASEVQRGREKDVSRMAARMLLHKRSDFQFEQEVRLLWITREQKKDFVSIDIDPMNVINEVMISPYESKSDQHMIQFYLRQYGIPVTVSDILAHPNGNFESI